MTLLLSKLGLVRVDSLCSLSGFKSSGHVLLKAWQPTAERAEAAVLELAWLMACQTGQLSQVRLLAGFPSSIAVNQVTRLDNKESRTWWELKIACTCYCAVVDRLAMPLGYLSAYSCHL